jgi:hypothetical protein
MSAPERVYRGSVRILSAAMVGLGIAILVTTLIAGGGLLDIGILLGVAFVAVGLGRLWLASRMRP